ncbi:hypothetical protein LCGC14_0350370 [marine sediment metagenome]|uniref:MobA-like NTP transferase domain-containing protein n=1 Tax=marine sediment metagenome TaxID=412755 RepID=A0A0F9TB83_9ZZZZ
MGTRNKYAKDTNKACLPIGGKPAISRMIDKFPEDVEIVIAVGHKAELVINVVMSSYLGRPNLIYMHVNYQGEGRGPGYSLLQCRPFLQCPFIYTCCDTLVLEDIPEPKVNWMGVSLVTEKLPYLTADVEDGLINKVYDKGDKNATYLASIGLVGVRDYKAFWEGLANPTIVEGEHQDTSGINALIPLYPEYFTWFDTGSTEGYENANRYFSKQIPK